MMENYKHKTVLLDEAVNGLNIRPDGIYIDGTFGRGGHSRLILSQLGAEGRLLAIDRDPQAIAVAQTIDDPRFSIVHGPFSALADYVAERGLTGKIDGILLDLGVSSPQLDDAERGFSFMRDRRRGRKIGQLFCDGGCVRPGPCRGADQDREKWQRLRWYGNGSQYHGGRRNRII